MARDLADSNTVKLVQERLLRARGPLTRLDERVLAELGHERGRRLYMVTWWSLRQSRPRGWKPSPDEMADVRAVLRGLEHLGKATGRGGWWRAL